jgi:ribosomal protein S25
MRRTIVFEVMVMKESLKNVCDRYGINFSSAKNVIQIYRKEGRLEKKIQK